MEFQFNLNNKNSFGSVQEQVRIVIDEDCIRKETGLSLSGENNPKDIKHHLKSAENQLKSAEKTLSDANKQVELNKKRSKMAKIAAVIVTLIGCLAMGALIGSGVAPGILFGGGVIAYIFIPFEWFKGAWFILPEIYYMVASIGGAILGAIGGTAIGISSSISQISPNIKKLQGCKEVALREFEEKTKKHDESLKRMQDIQNRLRINISSYKSKIAEKYDESNPTIHEAMTKTKQVWQASCEKAEKTLRAMEKLQSCIEKI